MLPLISESISLLVSLIFESIGLSVTMKSPKLTKGDSQIWKNEKR